MGLTALKSHPDPQGSGGPSDRASSGEVRASRLGDALREFSISRGPACLRTGKEMKFLGELGFAPEMVNATPALLLRRDRDSKSGLPWHCITMIILHDQKSRCVHVVETRERKRALFGTSNNCISNSIRKGEGRISPIPSASRCLSST